MNQRGVGYGGDETEPAFMVMFRPEIPQMNAQPDALKIRQHDGAMTFPGVFYDWVNERQRGREPGQFPVDVHDERIGGTVERCAQIMMFCKHIPN